MNKVKVIVYSIVALNIVVISVVIGLNIFDLDTMRDVNLPAFKVILEEYIGSNKDKDDSLNGTGGYTDDYRFNPSTNSDQEKYGNNSGNVPVVEEVTLPLVTLVESMDEEDYNTLLFVINELKYKGSSKLTKTSNSTLVYKKNENFYINLKVNNVEKTFQLKYSGLTLQIKE